MALEEQVGAARLRVDDERLDDAQIELRMARFLRVSRI